MVHIFSKTKLSACSRDLFAYEFGNAGAVLGTPRVRHWKRQLLLLLHNAAFSKRIDEGPSMPSTYNLNNKVALITGAARRIGAAVATRLHQSGADVAIHYRGSAGEAAALADKLNAQRPDSASIFAADLNDTKSLPGLVGAVLDWREQLDILVNNASSFYATPIGKINEGHWDELVGSNLKAPLFLSQAATPSLRESNGVIINIVDIHAQRPLRNHAVYGVAKAGLAMLTRSLAKDLAPSVRVNGVSPGAILWPEDELSDETKDTILTQIPLDRAGDPDDIAACVLFLARDASYVTGEIIAVDGGPVDRMVANPQMENITNFESPLLIEI